MTSLRCGSWVPYRPNLPFSLLPNILTLEWSKGELSPHLETDLFNARRWALDGLSDEQFNRAKHELHHDDCVKTPQQITVATRCHSRALRRSQCRTKLGVHRGEEQR